MTPEQELEIRVKNNKVNFLDAIQYARERGQKCESWDEIQHFTQEIYANTPITRMTPPGTHH